MHASACVRICTSMTITLAVFFFRPQRARISVEMHFRRTLHMASHINPLILPPLRFFTTTHRNLLIIALNIAHDSCSHAAERIIHCAESQDLKNTKREDGMKTECFYIRDAVWGITKKGSWEKALKQTFSVPQKDKIKWMTISRASQALTFDLECMNMDIFKH